MAITTIWNLQQAAQVRGLYNQSEIARTIGVHPSQICKLWNGKIVTINPDILGRLCKYFACSPSDLLAVVDTDDPSLHGELEVAA